MRLWTLQGKPFWRSLRLRGRVQQAWGRVVPLDKPPYLWMAHQMVSRGITKKPVPPIWAWHSCGAIGKGPTQETYDDLMGGIETTGIRIELEVPDHLVLLSHYGKWCDRVYDHTAGPGVHWTMVACNDAEDMFRVKLRNVKPWGRANHHDIQACLPYVKRSWVRKWEGIQWTSSYAAFLVKWMKNSLMTPNQKRATLRRLRQVAQQMRPKLRIKRADAEEEILELWRERLRESRKRR